MQGRNGRTLRVLAAGWAAVLAMNGLSRADDYARLSPFTGLRWKGEVPEARLRGTWYRVVAIDGVAVEEILAHAKQAHGRKWQRRFAEDLVQLMTEMGKAPGERVSLDLIKLKTGKAVHFDAVKMTHTNRQALLAQRRKAEERQGPAGGGWDARLSGEQIERDLRELREALEQRYSYLPLAESRGYDWRKALEEIEEQCRGGVTRRAFAIGLAEAINRFGDGHTRVRGKYEYLPGGYLPVVLEDVDGRLIVLKDDRSGLVDEKRPYLASIDGVAGEDWLKAASAMSAEGSAQFSRRNAIEMAHWATFVRQALRLDASESIAIELRDASGEDKMIRTLAVAGRPPQIVQRQGPTEGKALPGGIGYLRIAEMSDEPAFLDRLTTAMQTFANAPGLVIDVRGNPGGSRDALRTLYPMLCDGTEGPRVVNVAKYRLRPGEERGRKEGYLENRSLFPLRSKRWKAEERAAIEKFASGFEPEWTPPADQFSEWHYMVLGPGRGATPVYRGRVAVLMDEGCFSAADIFLGAMKGLPRVTLIGRASGGGSGRAARVTLSESRLEVLMSSMASFRPDGRLYDGRGVEPDVVVEREIGDILGTSDSALEAAMKHLRER